MASNRRRPFLAEEFLWRVTELGLQVLILRVAKARTNTWWVLVADLHYETSENPNCQIHIFLS